MTSIHTLIPDIQSLLKTEGWMTESLSKEFSHEVSIRLQEQFKERAEPPRLRLSQMGNRCPCALWHSIHRHKEADPLPPWAQFKYSFGHVIEALAVALSKAAGHEVTGEQDVLNVDGISGHRDCVIDGCIVDVKSAASFSFSKFKDGSIRQNDSFGYLDQLDGYLVGSLQDPLVRVKDRAYLLAIDKQLGHMCIYEHLLREQHIRERIRRYKEIVARDTPPACECGTVAEGKSGNIVLDTKASYNQFRHCCFPHLRTFLYATGPKYFTRVVRRPEAHIKEIDKEGRIVYNG